MNLGDKTFTGFSNVLLKGTATDNASAKEAELRFELGGAKTDTTLTVAQRGGSQEFPYLRVAGAGLSIGTGFIEVVRGSYSSTLAINSYQDKDYAISLPSKSGQIGVSGTFTVNLPVIGAASYTETAFVLSGIRAEDGLVCSLMSNSYETAVTTNRGFVMLGQARPSATGIDMVFLNPSATATVVQSPIIAYTVFR